MDYFLGPAQQCNKWLKQRDVFNQMHMVLPQFCVVMKLSLNAVLTFFFAYWVSIAACFIAVIDPF